MAIGRIAWLVTVLVALVTALLLGLSGYIGYAGLGVAVGGGGGRHQRIGRTSAAINLF